MKKWLIMTGLFSVSSGMFLVLDSLFIHGITYDYSKLNLSWLDPYIQHWMFGVIGVFLGMATLLHAFQSKR